MKTEQEIKDVIKLLNDVMTKKRIAISGQPYPNKDQMITMIYQVEAFLWVLEEDTPAGFTQAIEGLKKGTQKINDN